MHSCTVRVKIVACLYDVPEASPFGKVATSATNNSTRALQVFVLDAADQVVIAVLSVSGGDQGAT